MKKWSVFLFLLIVGCQNQNSKNTIDLSSYNYSVVIGYPNFEPMISDARNVYVHFVGTQSVFNLTFIFSKVDTIALSECLLLEFDDTVNVDEWINMHHCDAQNMYTFIDPKSYISDEYTMDLKIHSMVPVSARPKNAVFSVSFKNVGFESSDKFISAIALDSLYLFNHGGFVFIGPADSIAFQRPSLLGDIIPYSTGSYYTVIVKVLNKNSYSVDLDSSYTVKCVSTKPDFGIISDSIKETDTTGEATFKVEATNNGDSGDTIPLVASLVTKPTVTDTAFLIVGRPHDKLYIIYNDTAGYDVSAGITGCSGERVPVIIRASLDGISPTTIRNWSFSITFNGELAAYETETSTEVITTSQLVDGQVTIWIVATGESVTDGQIRITSNDSKFKDSERGNINFKACLP